MSQENTTTWSAARQERKYRRFNLTCSVHLKSLCGDLDAEVNAVSRNVSVGGLFLDVPLPIPQHSSVSFVLLLRGFPMIRPIELIGEGEIVRVETSRLGAGFGIAVKYTTPITQFER